MPYWMNGSARRASFFSMYNDASNPFTDELNLTGCSLVSKISIGAAPLTPANALAHDSLAVLPIGVNIPTPVTTTRRLLMQLFSG
jgi:hypothetical protein